jgi:hypothetical protein
MLSQKHTAMKNLLRLATVSILLVGLVSCGSDDPAPKRIDVYLGGQHYNTGVAEWQAAIWKNGVQTTLSDDEGYIQLLAVSPDGKDYYAYGDTGDDVAHKTLWKNGVATAMVSGFTQNQRITDMEVYDGDIYMAGYDWSVTPNQPNIWINGEKQLLENPEVAGGAIDILVSGNDLYVLGWITSDGLGKVVYWKNGVKHEITPAYGDYWAFSMAVSGNNVYAFGEQAKLGVWSNGVFAALPGVDPENWEYSNQIVVKGSDVYVAGSDYDAIEGEDRACYWKNGVKTMVDSPSGYSTVVMLAKSSKAVYAIGYVEDAAWYNVLWKEWGLVAPEFSKTEENVYIESVAVAEY